MMHEGKVAARDYRLELQATESHTLAAFLFSFNMFLLEVPVKMTPPTP